MDVGDPILAEDFLSAFLTAGVNLNTSSTSLQNVTGLSVPVVANATYFVDFTPRHSIASGTTEDVQYGFTFPTGATLRMLRLGGTPAGVSAGNSTDMSVTHDVFTSGSTAAAFGASTTTTGAIIRGILTMSSTAGTFQVQASQATSGGNVVTVQIGSALLLTRIA